MSVYTKRGIKERELFKDIFKDKKPSKDYCFTSPAGKDFYDFKLIYGDKPNQLFCYGEIKVRAYTLNHFNEWLIETNKIEELQKMEHNKLIMNIHSDGHRIWDITDLQMKNIGDKVNPSELGNYQHGDVVKMFFPISSSEDKGERWKDVVVLKSNQSIEVGNMGFNPILLNERVQKIFKERYQKSNKKVDFYS